MGATPGDVRKVARLIAVKTFINEFVAYNGKMFGRLQERHTLTIICLSQSLNFKWQGSFSLSLNGKDFHFAQEHYLVL